MNRISDLNSTQWHHQESAEAHASGNREAFTNDDRWKASWWTTSWLEESRWTWNDEVWGVVFFFKLRISPTRSGSYCVCDGGCTQTPCRTHIFLTHFPCVAQTSRTRTAQGVCSAHVISPHLTFSLLMFHPPSLLFPHGHLDISFLSAPSLPNYSRSESAGQAHFRTSASGHLADPTHSTCVHTIHICCSSPESQELSFCKPIRNTRCVASAPHPSFRLAKAKVYFPASTRVDRVERSFRLDRSRIRLICEIEVICSVIVIEAHALFNSSEVRGSLWCLMTVLTTTFLLGPSSCP